MKANKQFNGLLSLAIVSLLSTLVSCEDLKFFYTVSSNSVQCFLQQIQVDHVGKYTNIIEKSWLVVQTIFMIMFIFLILCFIKFRIIWCEIGVWLDNYEC